MSRLARFAVAGMLGIASWAGCASAQDAGAPRFPEGLDRETLLIWLKRETDITPNQVVAVTPPAVTALVSTFPASGEEGARVVIRAEALSPETYGRTGALSWHVSLSADCANRRLRMGETTGYTERNLLGERRVLRPADTIWRAPEPGTALESAWQAACDPTFHGPLGDGAAITSAGSDSATRRVRVLQAEDQRAAELLPPAKRATGGATVRAASAKPSPPKPTVLAKASPPAAMKGSIPPRAMIATAPKPQGGGHVVAQLGAFGSEAQARAALAGVKSRLAGHATRVEAATVDGKTWSRALVTGFADSAEVTRFCATLNVKACFARAK